MMMDNLDTNFEQRKLDYENGKISFDDLTIEEVKFFGKCYINEIKENKKEIQKTRKRIKELKEKMNNIT